MTILYYGDMWALGTCLQRGEALKRLGHQVTYVDAKYRIDGGSELLLVRGLQRIVSAWAKAMSVRKITNLANPEFVDVVWFDKPTAVTPRLLQTWRHRYPSAKFVSYSPDDMFNPANSSAAYRSSISSYDYHITTKSYNVPELYEAGARRVLFVDNAYCPKTFCFRPQGSGVGEIAIDVSFVGSYEVDRAKIVQRLWSAGIEIRVFGPGWSRIKTPDQRHLIDDRWIPAPELVGIVNRSLINLCFLRKANRDLQTTRSVEIPGCGGFMIAERTEEHMRIFREGEAAEYFSDADELIRKIKYYLEYPEIARKVGLAALEQCLVGGYSNDQRLKTVLARIIALDRDE
jgi:spore maturation protein CgeB